jgi:hypothetical protein
MAAARDAAIVAIPTLMPCRGTTSSAPNSGKVVRF